MKNKRSTKILSLVLALFMAFSLVPVTASAEGTGAGVNGGWWNQGWGGWRELPVEEPVAPDETVSFPAAVLTSDAIDGLTVKVDAPEGTLPEGTEMTVTPVRLDAVQTAVDNTEGVNGTVLAAADITFLYEGKEIQPDGEITVTMTSAQVTDPANTSVVHLDASAAELENAVVDAEPVENVLAQVQAVTFDAEHFSVYAIVWGEDQSATVHWGTMNGETFEEFDESKVVALDTTGGTISLDVDFEGYDYVTALYQAADTSTQVAINATLKKVDGKWQVGKRVTNTETGEVEIQWADLNNEDDIYVLYQEHTGTTPSGAGNDDIPSPTTDKDVHVNADGTRTITLDVTGDTVQQTDAVGANVLILLDRTGSMSASMSSGGTRMAAAKSAINTLVGILTGGENPGTINYSLLDFYVDWGGWASRSSNKDRLHSWNSSTGAHQSTGTNYWTTNASTFNSYIQNNSYSYASGSTATNWESPLHNALTILNTRNTSNQTYVIFITDGEPNTYGTGNTVSDPDESYFGNYYMNQANYAAVQAITSLPNVSLYGVFCGSASGFNTLETTVNDHGGVDTINGSDTPALTAAFADIAHTIVEEMGASNVSVDDGIPSLSSVSAKTSGEAGGYEYYRLYPLTRQDNGSYTYTVAKDDVRTVTAAEFDAKKDSQGNLIEQKDGKWYIEVKWTEGYPGASYNQANGVTWDLSTVSVVPGVTYRLKFKVWPSQEAYDYIANLNNGLVSPMPTDDELAAMGIEKNAQGIYYLLTNTHLKTNYSYGGNDYSDSPSVLPTSEMILPTTTITVKKIWNNDLDARTASDVRLTVTKDGQPYLYDQGEDTDPNKIRNAIPMGNAVEQPGGKQWIQTNNKPIYISMGQLTLDSSNNIEVISSGHDYTVTEPESFSYNWELTSDVYHPMVINGTPTVLVLVNDEDVPAALENLDNNKKATEGGKDYYKFDNKLYVAQAAGDNVLTAVNDRRSNLNFTKTVEAAEGISIPEDALFTYKIKVTYPEGINDDVWFSLQGANESLFMNGDYGVDDYVTGAQPEAAKEMDASYVNPVFHEADDVHPYPYYTFTRYGQAGHARAADRIDNNRIYTGFYFAPDDTEFTVKIRAGWNVRFTNLPNGTTYEITEIAMADGFVFKSLTSAADNGGTLGTVAGQKVSGTIDKPNNVYTATFTNECMGFFYVYHSSDNTVVRYPMAVDGVKYEAGKKTFNIYELTKANTLYGGYYHAYAGATISEDEGNTLTYNTDNVATDNGHAYNYQYIKNSGKAAWTYDEAYTANGTAMVPEANKVYFLKEVPNGYLRTYNHYTYYVANGIMASMWAVTALDDACYDSAYFIVTNEDDPTSKPATVAASVTIRAENSSTGTRLTPSRMFKGSYGVVDGYVGYAEISEFVGSNITIQQFWVTKDGIVVHGDSWRSLDTSNGKNVKGQATYSDNSYPMNP